jgi:hypothetical protein
MSKNILKSFIIIVGLLLIFSYIGLQIYLWITFGNTPIGEIPAWALWLMLGK